MRSLLLAAVVAVALAGCSSRSSLTPASAVEAEKLAHELEARVHALDPGADLFSFDARIDEAEAALPSPDWRAAVRHASGAHAAKGAMMKVLPTAQLVETLKGGGAVALLRMRTVEGRPAALFHLHTKAGGVGYFDFVVADVDGKPKVIDYVGSSTCRSHVATVLEMSDGLASGATDPLKRLSSTMEAAEAVKTMSRAVQEQRWADALKNYDALPERMKTDRTMLTLRLGAARHTSHEAVLAALAALRAQASDPECTELLAIDAELDANADDDALKSIDALDKAVGGDPWLDTLRARVFRKQGRTAEADAAEHRAGL